MSRITEMSVLLTVNQLKVFSTGILVAKKLAIISYFVLRFKLEAVPNTVQCVQWVFWLVPCHSSDHVVSPEPECS